MLPYIVIGIAAIVGLFGWGFKGLIFGALCGWIFNMVLGLSLTLFSGGLLPRKVRRQAASSFIISHEALVQRALSNVARANLQQTVEQHIEAIFKRAAIDNKHLNLEHGLDRVTIQSAAAALVAEAQQTEMKELIAALEQHVEEVMYY